MSHDHGAYLPHVNLGPVGALAGVLRFVEILPHPTPSSRLILSLYSLLISFFF